MVYVIVLAALALTGLLLWRRGPVLGGERRRQAQIEQALRPIRSKLTARSEIKPEEVVELSRRPELRFDLYLMLRTANKRDLLPGDFDEGADQAESALAHHLLHPAEAGMPPEEMVLEQAFTAKIEGAERCLWILRYRLPGTADWRRGIVGPTDPTATPYERIPAAYTGGEDAPGEESPEAFAAWWLKLLEKRGLIGAWSGLAPVS